MADDGMLLNFSLGDEIISTQQKFKGGAWKDRLAAKKIALHWQKRPAQSISGEPRNSAGSRSHEEPGRNEEGNSRPQKRQRLDPDSFKPRATTTTGSRPSDKPQGQGQQRKEVISSLFSFNPVAKIPAADTPTPGNENDAEASKASNAPLIDGIDTFTSLGLSPNLAAHLLTKLNLKNPTAVQKSSIPQLLKGDSDGFIQAQTGSGKTLAYLLPLVQQLMNLSSPQTDGNNEPVAPIHRDSGLFAIILAPTRELCKQISVVLDGLLNCAHWLVAGTVIGGEKKKSEKARLRKGLNILVATPGRLADHLENTKVLDVSRVRWLVLDEGDRLMELGFEQEIQGIIKKLDGTKRPVTNIANLPSKRSTILCSATLKMNVQRLGEMSLKDAIHIKPDPTDEDANRDENTLDQNDKRSSDFSAPAQLKQSYVVVASKLRLVALTALLKRTFARKGSVMKAIVFITCADSVDFHFEIFSRKDDGTQGETKEISTTDKKSGDDSSPPGAVHGTVAKSSTFSNPSNTVIIHKLHGSLPQNVRTATLSAFANQKDTSLLICTDVASRGLDLPDVDLVIEYDPAFSADDHLHRIGRTARLGRDGRAVIFLLPGNEEGYIDVLKRGYRDGNERAVTRSDANEILKRGFGANNDAASKGWEDAATDWQLDVERWTLENPTMLEMGRRAYQSHIRAYATHTASERNMFNIKDLHLGHLAKSFALRDRPAKINVPGLRSSKDETKKTFKANRPAQSGNKKKTDVRSEDVSSSDLGNAARKMRMKLKEQMAGASEFNIA
ncbi:ATP-dependent RNA helicase dbp7 [Myotisia sp. PD_48]|nr:ATP-dependent RNA helicase dbp7 [Myotisia sp. PD_48]